MTKGGGQVESLCYFDHHTHFMTCTVIINFYSVTMCCDYTFLSMSILCKYCETNEPNHGTKEQLHDVSKCILQEERQVSCGHS